MLGLHAHARALTSAHPDLCRDTIWRLRGLTLGVRATDLVKSIGAWVSGSDTTTDERLAQVDLRGIHCEITLADPSVDPTIASIDRGVISCLAVRCLPIFYTTAEAVQITLAYNNILI